MASGPPSGAQHVIQDGAQIAVVTSVGATLREYRVGDRPVLDGFDEGSRAVDGRGQVLAPWPNRLSGGQYEFMGRAVQAPLNEPSRSGAIHGLVRWLDWRLVLEQEAAVALSCTLHPQPGYEWSLELTVEYRLTEDGLVVSAGAHNPGDEPAPFGIGFHPYLTLRRQVDELELRVAAGAPDDFRRPRLIAGAVLDTCFSSLEPDGDLTVAELSDPLDGSAVAVWADPQFRCLMVYTADTVGDVERRRRAVAVEPMSCPPDALRTGADLIVLDPGDRWQAQWGLRAKLAVSDRGATEAREAAERDPRTGDPRGRR